MFRLSALNESENDHLDTETGISAKRTQVQIILREYDYALRLLINGKKQEALVLFDQLLNKVMQYDIVGDARVDNQSQLLFNLKCSTLKNSADIHLRIGDLFKSLSYLYEAISLDDSDTLLWSKIGSVAMFLGNLEMSSLGLRMSLNRNSDHWPTIDSIIIILYGLRDIFNCFSYIVLALIKDQKYKKGLVLGHEIMTCFPVIMRQFDPSTKGIGLNCFKEIQAHDNDLKNILSSVERTCNEWIKSNSEDIFRLSRLSLRIRVPDSWLEMGNIMLRTLFYILENNLNVFSPIRITCHEICSLAPTMLYCNEEIELPELHEHLSYVKQCLSNDFLRMTDNLEQVNQNQTRNVHLMDQGIQNPEAEVRNLQYPDPEVDISKSLAGMSSLLTHPSIENLWDAREISSDDLNKENEEKNQHPQEQTLRSGGIHQTDEPDQNLIERPQMTRKCSRISTLPTLPSDPRAVMKRSLRVRTSVAKGNKNTPTLEGILNQVFPSIFMPDDEIMEMGRTLRCPDKSFKSDPKYPAQEDLNKLNLDKLDYSMGPLKISSSKTERNQNFQDISQRRDVGLFMKSHNSHSNILAMMINFMDTLSMKWDLVWPDGLRGIYLWMYSFVRSRAADRLQFSSNDSGNIMNFGARTTLLFWEFFMDQWSHSGSLPSSSLGHQIVGLSPIKMPHSSHLDIEDHASQDHNSYYFLRYLRIQANFSLWQKDMVRASGILEKMSNHIRSLSLDVDQFEIRLVNLQHDSIISLYRVQELLEQIQRVEDFERIHSLYQQEEYGEVSRILIKTFHPLNHHGHLVAMRGMLLRRSHHFIILLESLWRSQEFQDCYNWSEACLHESLQVSLQDEEDGLEWMETVGNILAKMDDCAARLGVTIGRALSPWCQLRLVRNLTEIIHSQLDLFSGKTLCPPSIVEPWTILYQVIQAEEDRLSQRPVLLTALGTRENSSSEIPEDEEFSASTMVLIKAHELLGHRGLCTAYDGKLLTSMMKICIPKLHFLPQSSIKGKLRELLEQAVFCLYGFPSKCNHHIKSRFRTFEEHVKTHLTLRWDTCSLLFEIYRPTRLPNFDSKRIDSINGETVDLFKTISGLVPKEHDPTSLMDDMKNYLLGNTEIHPRMKRPPPEPVSYIYYLIADYYFKTVNHQSWANAIRYYMLDLCLHPASHNAWVGLAMATSTLMETWLNNFHPNMTGEKYLIRARIAQRSYQRAVELDPHHLTVWTEYGNFLYTVHSFCSRSLKQESDSLSMGRFQYLENRKEESLDIANHCFSTAKHVYQTCEGMNEFQDERWLYQYMQGKIVEKKNMDPSSSLGHFLEAHRLLHSSAAQYPKRINHKNPQNLAIEALEVYYRVHASILKFLDKNDDKPLKRSLLEIFKSSLRLCMASPCTVYEFVLDGTCGRTASSGQDWKRSLRSEGSCDQFCSRGNKIREDVDPKLTMNPRGVFPLIPDKISPGNHTLTQSAAWKSVSTEGIVPSLDVPVKEKNNSTQPQTDIVNLQESTESVDTSLTYTLLNDRARDCDVGGDRCPGMSYVDSKPKRIELLDSAQESAPIRNKNVRRESGENTISTQVSTSDTQTSTSSSNEDSEKSEDSDSSTCSNEHDSWRGRAELQSSSWGDTILGEGPTVTRVETDDLVQFCLAGLEQCVLRFPEHHKSIFRLAHFFFFNERYKDVVKSKQLLLGSYDCQFYPGQSIQGLFAERKSTNFFNGIWRIPVHEIDRPGSFASHMSKSILLLMQVLNESGDSNMLTELCLHLGKMPETDKKYLRDNDRRQLARQALVLCTQCLRGRLKLIDLEKNSSIQCSSDGSIQILLDIYQTFQAIRQVQDYEHNDISKMQKLLGDAYSNISSSCGPLEDPFERAVGFCKQKVRQKRTTSLFNLSPHVDVSSKVFGPKLCQDPKLSSEHESSMERRHLSESEDQYHKQSSIEHNIGAGITPIDNQNRQPNQSTGTFERNFPLNMVRIPLDQSASAEDRAKTQPESTDFEYPLEFDDGALVSKSIPWHSEDQIQCTPNLGDVHSKEGREDWGISSAALPHEESTILSKKSEIPKKRAGYDIDQSITAKKSRVEGDVEVITLDD